MLTVNVINSTPGGQYPDGSANYAVSIKIGHHLIFSGTVTHMRSEPYSVLLRTIADAVDRGPRG